MIVVGGPTSGGGFGPLIQPVADPLKSLIINRGFATTFYRYVELEFFCLFAGGVQYVEGTDPTNAPWVEPMPKKEYMFLSAGDGIKTVSARFRAYPGNYSETVQAQIILAEDQVAFGSELCMNNLRWLLANSQLWQQWTSSATPDEAQMFIHKRIYRKPIEWPYILITEVPMNDYQAEGTGPGYSFVNKQTFNIWFECNVGKVGGDPDVEGWEHLCTGFARIVDEIMREVRQLSCTDNLFCAETIQQSEPVTIPDPTIIESEGVNATLRTGYTITATGR